MTLHEDQYIITPAQDQLGRGTLVDLIVKAIKTKVQNSHGAITIGIYGSWGEGKTTTMRMVEHDLRLSGISCLWFDPWSYSGDKRLVDEFFGKLASFSYPESNIGKIIPSYREAYLQYEGQQSNPVLTAYQTSLAKSYPFNVNDIEDIKKSISDKLDKDKQHVVVFIDDVDRLDTGEVQVLFKMIRQVVDFKNIVYVIGMDPDIVSQQLGLQYGDSQQQRGREYMEKIINIPIILPAVQDARLMELMRKELIEVWQENNLPVDEKDIDTVVNALLPVMNTKRAIDRFANQLSFIVPTIGIETEFVDLCLVESLKYLNEKGWIEIYNQRKSFLKEGIFLPSGDEREKEEKRVFEEAVNRVAAHYDEKWKSYVIDILTGHLFTKIHHYNANKLSKCINNEQYFKQYFIAGIPKDTIPRAEAIVFAKLLLEEKAKSIDWINEKLEIYSSEEVDRSACLALDINREVNSVVVAEKLTEVLAFSDLAKNYSYNTVSNPSRVAATIYAHIIPMYMVSISPEYGRIVDVDAEARVLTAIFKEAELNFCMTLFAGVYEYVRPRDKSVFEVLKTRLLGEGKRTIFSYSFPIKGRFFLEWKETNLQEYKEYWTEILAIEDFDLGEVIKEWLIAVSPQDQLSEVGTLKEILEPVTEPMKTNLYRSKYKDDKLLRLFVWNCGLFEKSFGDEPIYNNTEELMKNIEISENFIEGDGGRKVKIAILRAIIPTSNIQAINDMMDVAVSEYVLNAGHNTFKEVNVDMPNLRVIISDLNSVEFKPYKGEHL